MVAPRHVGRKSPQERRAAITGAAWSVARVMEVLAVPDDVQDGFAGNSLPIHGLLSAHRSRLIHAVTPIDGTETTCTAKPRSLASRESLTKSCCAYDRDAIIDCSPVRGS